MAETWFCALAQYRLEEQAVKNLEQRGFQAWLPMMLHKPKRGLALLKPLFTGYVFVKVEEAQSWHPILGTVGVKSLIKQSIYPHLPIPIKNNIIEALSAQWSATIPDDLTIRFEKDSKVVIIDGPFEGHQALVKYNETDRIVLMLMLFGREVIVRYKPAQLRAIK